jgi:hypothetical protein
MSTPRHLVLIGRIPTVDEIEAIGSMAPISLDRTVIDRARGTTGSPQVGEPWPESDDSTVRDAVEHWLDWQT